MQTVALVALVFLSTLFGVTLIAAFESGYEFLPSICPVPRGLFDPGWVAKTETLPKTEVPCLEFWLNRYQTLVGAVVALVASAVAFLAVRMQVVQAETAERRRRDSGELASRAVLGPALGSLCQYAEACIGAASANPSDPRSQFEFPPFPSEVIPPIRDAINYAEDPTRSELVDLMAHVQIFISRTAGRRRGGWRAEQHIFDAADLSARASRFFDYARAHMDPNLVSAEQIESTLVVSGTEPSHFELLPAMLEKRANRGAETKAERPARPDRSP